MEKNSCDSKAESPVTESGLPGHCIRLTREQYHTLCDLRNDPLFKRALISPSGSSPPPPSWEKLLASKKPHTQCVVWMVHHYWLGSLKFALLSKSVEGADKLYRDVFKVYQELLQDLASSVFPPRTRRLVFDHVGCGLFRLRLTLIGEVKQVRMGKPLVISEDECQRKAGVLAAEALHVTRGSPWPKLARSLHGHVPSLPLNLLQEGVDFSPEGLDEAMIGPTSAAYRHELRRTVAYVAEQMETRGERVDWDYLHVGVIAEEQQDSPHNLISTLSKRLDDFIEDHLLQT